MHGVALPLASLRLRDLPRAGAKAARLGELCAAGFPVPHGFVIPVEAHRRWLDAGAMPDEVRAALGAVVAALGDGPLAVRSSAIDEDHDGASFAGQYETVLGVRGAEAVVAAVVRCWASAGAPRVIAYRRARGEEGAAGMAVLVQRLVPAEAAGVALTANPVTGARGEVVISAVRGLGERLVAGEADADEWTVTATTTTRRRAAADALDAEGAREVAGLARRVEAHFRSPQDVEWARAGGRTWLLQARPITALPEPVSWAAPPGGWGRHLRLGEWLGDPVTPLFQSWLLTRMERRMFANYDAIGGIGPAPEPLHLVVNGWYYMTFDLLPGSPWGILAFLGRFAWKLVRNPRRAVMIVPPLTWLGVDAMVEEWRGTIAPAYAAAVAEAEARVDTLDEAGLTALIDRLADHAGDWFTSITFVAGHAWKCEAPLATFFRVHLAGRVEGSHAELLAGLYAPVHAPHAVYGLDWFHPTAGETGAAPDPEAARARRTQLEARREALEAACRAALTPARAGELDRLLLRARRFAPLREEQAAGLTAAWPVLRRAVRRLGAGLAARGVLADADDVWFLRREELDGGGRVDTAARRSEWERQRRLAAPLVLGEIPAAIRGVNEQHEALFRTSDPLADGALRGLGASPGRVTAIARVVRSPAEFDRLRPGEVLVAPATTPAWTPLFARAAAVVTDTGSPLAHASLVAREYGIPAVVGTGDATTRIIDGERVTVDGVRGVVERPGTA
ncbi:MAG: PEP/pyruvate-binding domain-containing protein [Pseudomonadota bacterium]|nr:PEP/pyruvate-binding domain-containing protein [Pseudomonadota bacterium]